MENINLKSISRSDLALDGTEGARRATGVPSNAGDISSSITLHPDPEVSEKKPRRRFSAGYKLRIIKEYDACSKPGEIGSLLRREGLYSSHINSWIKQRDKGILTGLSPKKRGRKVEKANPLAKEIANLERENKKLSHKLKQAETIIEVQKKLSELLGISPKSNGGTN